MRRRQRLPSQLAADLGVSHATVHRWLFAEDTPSTESCRRLAEYSGVPPTVVLSLTGHLPSIDDISSNLPEFPEYARRKYPNELDEDLITMIEDLVECRREKCTDEILGSASTNRGMEDDMPEQERILSSSANNKGL